MSGRAGPVRPVGVLTLIAAVLVAGLVTVVSVRAGATPYLLLSATDPGPAVRIITPLARLLTDLSAALCLGSLVYVTFCTDPGEDGLLRPAGYRAVRSAARWAAVWAVAEVGGLVFDTAGVAGVPLRQLLTPHGFHVAVTVTESPKAWIAGLVAVLVLAAACRSALHWRTAVGLTLLAALALLPPLVTGHLASEAGHDLGTDAIMLHVLAATTWLGFVLAYARFARTSTVHRRRYLQVTGCCWLILAGTGVVQSLELVDAHDLIRTGYGLLVLISAAVAVLLVPMAMIARRRMLGRPTALLAIEASLLTVAMGASAAMTHLAPPRLSSHRSSNAELLVGYPLHGSLTALGLLTQWRIDLLFGPAALLLAYGYERLRRRATPTLPLWRTISWMTGCAVLLLITCAGAGRYAPAMFSAHIVRHMVLSMLVPLLLALGDPIGVAQRAGLADHHRYRELSRWSAVRSANRPATTLVLFTLSPFALYFTGLWDLAVRFHWAHQAIDVYFLLVGLAFMLQVAGAGRSLPSLIRLGMLLVAMPLDTLFATLLIQLHRVIGNGSAGSNFYQALALPWVQNLHADQRHAGIIAFAVGGLVLFGALINVVLTWSSGDPDHALLLSRDDHGPDIRDLDLSRPPRRAAAAGAEPAP